MGGRPPDEAGSGAETARPARAARLVVVARLSLALLAGWAAWFALVRVDPGPRRESAAIARYVCPMHPSVVAAHPGDCPICGMALRLASVDAPRAEPPPRLTGAVDRARRRVLSYDVTAPAWVHGGALRAHLYLEDAATLALGEGGVFHPALAPARTVAVHFAGGARPWDSSTSEVEFVFAPHAPALVEGTAGWLTLPSRHRAALVVPASAVLQSEDGPYVLAAADDGTFTRRPIRIGRTSAGVVSVLEGLREGERVTIRGAFFLDSSLRLARDTESPVAAAR